MRLRSLRSRLIVMIIGPLLVIASLAAVARYVLALGISERLYDHTLAVVALAVSRDVVLSEGDLLAERLRERLSEALGDPIYYRVTGPGGRFITGYSDAPAPPGQGAADAGQPAFYDGVYLGAPVRGVVLREFIAEPQIGGWVTVHVWQNVTEREALSLELVGHSLLLLFAVIVTACATVWFGVTWGLRPLLSLRDAVRQRSPDDLGAIRRPLPREVRPLAEAMNALFLRLASAFSERDALISDAAHQLRNPIAGIRAQAEAAETTSDPDELRQRVAEVAEAARHASRLTQQLLSMEKARGRRTAQGAPAIDMAALAAEVARIHAPAALRRGVDLSFERGDGDAMVRGDRVMLGEALDNLLDNALRYGGRDGGAVRVEVGRIGDRVRFAVADDGPGVAATDRERIFDRFYRGADDGSDGCGLGLPIVREIAARHGGAVRLVEGSPGARFELDLPAAE
jgi:two-component system sensor histidine kinase TctE